MRIHERWICDIYTKAEVIEEAKFEQDLVEMMDLVEGRAAQPDQPGAQVLKEDINDLLTGISAPFGGDQLTRVRFAGARDLVAGNKTAAQRFDHTFPYICELWHTKASFLQVSFQN